MDEHKKEKKVGRVVRDIHTILARLAELDLALSCERLRDLAMGAQRIASAQPERFDQVFTGAAIEPLDEALLRLEEHVAAANLAAKEVEAAFQPFHYPAPIEKKKKE